MFFYVFTEVYWTVEMIANLSSIRRFQVAVSCSGCLKFLKHSWKTICQMDWKITRKFQHILVPILNSFNSGYRWKIWGQLRSQDFKRGWRGKRFLVWQLQHYFSRSGDFLADNSIPPTPPDVKLPSNKKDVSWKMTLTICCATFKIRLS